MRKPLLLLLPLSLTFAACATAPAQTPSAAPSAAPAGSVPLSDFRNPAEIARFEPRGIQASHFTTGSAPGSANLVFDKWQPGSAEWPALILRAGKGLPSDWSGFDCLTVEVRNDGSAPFDLALFAQDDHGVSAGHHFILPPGRTQTLRWPLAQAEGLDLAHIEEAQLYATRPAAETPLVISGLRLEKDPAARRTAFDATVDSVNAAFDQQRRAAKDPDLRQRIAEAWSASRSLQARLRASQDRAEQDALRAQLLAGKASLSRQIPREAAEATMRREFQEIDRNAPYACGFATSMEKVLPVDLPFHATVARTASLSLAGNETEALQLLVLADKQRALSDVQVTAGPLTRADGRAVAALLTPSVQVAPVGFVHTKRPSYKVDYVGWYPDPILDFLPGVSIRSGEMQPFWVRVTAPENAPAGDYTATLTVRPANAPPVTLHLQVTVWGFSLTPQTHLRTAVSVREPMIQQVYGGTLTEAMRQKYYRFLLRYRINPDDIYRYETPRVSDLELWNKLGMNAFNLVYAVKPADLQPGAPYPAERKSRILAQLDAIIPQLKADGLYSKAYVYGFDEVSSASYAAMKDIFSAIRAKYPDLLLLTTARDATYGEKSGLSMVNGWVPLTPSFDPKRAEEARKQGKQVWWYTCIAPQKPYANWLIEYDAIDARSLMGLQSVKYQPDGYLYYAVNRWPLSKKPITSGPYTDWPSESFDNANGDGSFLCAGPDGPLATIRMENIRDGIEDYEYFWLLQQEIQRLKASPRPESAAVLRQAERAATVDPNLVQDLTHFSKSPEALYAKRRQVAEAILAARRITQP